MKRPLSIQWTRRSVADLEAIAEYIARENPAAADAWVLKLTTRLEAVAGVPWSGRKVPELGRDDLREVIMRGYRLVYRVRARRITVLTVFEGHRLLPPLTPPR